MARRNAIDSGAIQGKSRLVKADRLWEKAARLGRSEVANGGLEYEADQRHTEISMKDMGMDDGSRGFEHCEKDFIKER